MTTTTTETAAALASSLDGAGDDLDRLTQLAEELRVALTNREARRQHRPLALRVREVMRLMRDADIALERLATAIEGKGV
jgi:hypothetical protein